MAKREYLDDCPDCRQERAVNNQHAEIRADLLQQVREAVEAQYVNAGPTSSTGYDVRAAHNQGVKRALAAISKLGEEK